MLTIPTDTAWRANIHIAAMSDQGDAAYFSRHTAVLNTLGTVTLFGTATLGTDDGTGPGHNVPSGWSLALAVGASNDLAIQVTGPALTNIRWVARVELTEVSFPHA